MSEQKKDIYNKSEKAIDVDVYSSNALTTVLPQIIIQINSLGGDFDREKQSLEELGERLRHGYYHLAVLGQFKRGKSTFLNALIGQDLLPSSIVPLTAIPTFIRYSALPSVVIHFNDDRQEKSFAVKNIQEAKNILSSFVTEESNPKNKLGVLEAELLYPADILSKGVVFIDTPGIGSTFRHNTEATLNFLPQCDAALFLVSSDPPITEVEVAFLKEVKQKISRLFFVLNKADYLDEDERKTALGFFKQVLKEQVGFDSGIDLFCVSAKQGLKAGLNYDSSLWEISGMESVRSHLIDFCAHEKAIALSEAVSRKAVDILERIAMRFRLMVSSLRMPLEDLEQRLAVFTEKVGEIEQEKTVAKDILTGDQKRMHELLEEKASALRDQSRKYLGGILAETVYRKDNRNVEESELQVVLAEAIPGYFEHEFGQMTNFFKQQRNKIFEKHQKRVESLMDSIRKTAAELFEIPYTPSGAFTPLKIAVAPYWVTHTWQASLLPVSLTFIDNLLSEQKRQKRILERLKEQVAQLVMSNVENLRWSLFQTIDREFISFCNMLDEQFRETVNVLHGVTCAALEKRKAHASEITQEVVRLENDTKKIEMLLEKIESLKER